MLGHTSDPKKLVDGGRIVLDVIDKEETALNDEVAQPVRARILDGSPTR